MPINQENGVSVYCNKPIEERENSPLYKSVRELVNKYSRGGLVLDLGCSDLVASRVLQRQGFNVVGLDLDDTALRAAKINAPEISVIKADVSRLPVRSTAAVDIVLLLDVLEHLQYQDARSLLSSFAGTGARVIVTMPIISPFSIPSNKELLQFVRDGHRPTMGLFDRTHQILTDRIGHKKLFQSAGLGVLEEFNTNPAESVSGDWEWKKTFKAEPPNYKVLKGVRQGLRQVRGGPFRMVVFDLIPRLVHPLDPTKRREVTDRLIEYQGIYVLGGKTSENGKVKDCPVV